MNLPSLSLRDQRGMDSRLEHQWTRKSLNLPRHQKLQKLQRNPNLHRSRRRKLLMPRPLLLIPTPCSRKAFSRPSSTRDHLRKSSLAFHQNLMASSTSATARLLPSTLDSPDTIMESAICDSTTPIRKLRKRSTSPP